MSFQGARGPSPSRTLGSGRQRRLSQQSSRNGAPLKTEAEVVLAAAKPAEPLAEWRVRVHAARRRTMIVIATTLWFKRGHRSHPVRLPRLDDLGFLIPVNLGNDTASFIKEFLRYVTTQKQARIVANKISPLSLSVPHKYFFALFVFRLKN